MYMCTIVHRSKHSLSFHIYVSLGDLVIITVVNDLKRTNESIIVCNIPYRIVILTLYAKVYTQYTDQDTLSSKHICGKVTKNRLTDFIDD